MNCFTCTGTVLEFYKNVLQVEAHFSNVGNSFTYMYVSQKKKAIQLLEQHKGKYMIFNSILKDKTKVCNEFCRYNI